MNNYRACFHRAIHFVLLAITKHAFRIAHGDQCFGVKIRDFAG
jgi:hypothetical protein